VDEGKAVNVVYLDFSNIFDIISYNILLETLGLVAWTGALFSQ